MIKFNEFNESLDSNELMTFVDWLLKNCYILNNTKWEYRGNYYSTLQIYDLYIKLDQQVSEYERTKL